MKKINRAVFTIKTLIVFAILCARTPLAQGQTTAPNIEWQKSLGGTSDDAANCIQQTADNGYIVAGYSMSNDGDVTGNHGGSDYWVTKLDSAGSMLWQKSLGGTNHEIAYSVQQTTDNGYIVAGYSLSNDGDVAGNHGGHDYWVVKLDSAGTIEWQKCLGGTGDDITNSIQQTTDNGYIIAGYSLSNDGDVAGNHGGHDYWVVKLDSAGTIEWQKCLGGTDDDAVYSIQQTIDSGYIIAGYSMSNDGDVAGNHGWADYWVVKLNNTGIIEWQKCLGGTGDEIASSIQQTTDSGYIVAGYSSSNDGDVTGNHGDYDFWVVKLDSTGIIEWQKSFGGTSFDLACSIQQTTDSGYIVAGYSASIDGDVTGNHGIYDYWAVKLDGAGIMEWQKSLGGTLNESAFSIQQTNNNGYIVCGSSKSNNGDVTGHLGSTIYGDYWIVKLAPTIDSIITEVGSIDAPYSVKVYPNPFTNEINIEVGDETALIIMTDVVGRVVKQMTSVNYAVLNTVNVPSGVYFLKINYKNKLPVTVKILAE